MTARKAAPYMKTWVVEEIADTAGLTQAQVGAYWLLKMAMWRAGGKLPANDGALAVIARCDMNEWMAMRERILALFQRRGGIIRQARMTEAISDYENSFCARSKGGKATAAKKGSKNNGNEAHSAHTQPQASRHNQNKNQKEERASKKALSSDALSRPENYSKIRKAVVAERDEAFALSYLDPAVWRGGSVVPRTGVGMVKLAELNCLPELLVGIILKD